jgi:hypothetical protein
MLRNVPRHLRSVCMFWTLAIANLSVSVAASPPDLDDAQRLPRLVMIAPGTEIAAEPPRGWTHCVIRSVPRLVSGALDTLPDSAKTTATLFRTVILANVVSGKNGFELAKVGVGSAMPFERREVVVSSKGPATALSKLTTIESLVLNEVETEMKKGRLIARTPTFAVLKTPGTVLASGRHLDVDLCYAVCVNPASGALRTFCWAVPENSSKPPREIIAMPPKARFDCAVDVAVSRSIGPLSLSWTFAMIKLPPGQALPVSASLGREISGLAAGQTDPRELERTVTSQVEHISRR